MERCVGDLRAEKSVISGLEEPRKGEGARKKGKGRARTRRRAVKGSERKKDCNPESERCRERRQKGDTEATAKARGGKSALRGKQLWPACTDPTDDGMRERKNRQGTKATCNTRIQEP